MMLYVKVSSAIENRRVKYTNGGFYYEADYAQMQAGTGSLIKVPEDDLTEYLNNTLMNINRDPGIDELFYLNILDQDIFRLRYWKDTGNRNTISRANELVNAYKETLKTNCLLAPDRIANSAKEKRKKYHENCRFDGYLLQLLKEGVIDNNVLVKSGFFKSLNIDRINELMSEKFLVPNDIIGFQEKGFISRECAIEALGGLDKIVSHYLQLVKQEKAKFSQRYISLIGEENALELYSQGRLGIQDIERLSIKKEHVLGMLNRKPKEDDSKTTDQDSSGIDKRNEIADEEQSEEEKAFIIVLKRGLPKGVDISSEEIISNYYKKLSGKSLIELVRDGVIEPCELIDIPEIEVEENSSNRKLNYKNLESFYTPQYIAELLMQEEINSGFLRKWSDNYFTTYDKETKKEFSKTVLELCRNTMNDYQYNRLFQTIQNNDFLPSEFLQNNELQDSGIEEMYYNDEISDDEIINYYNQGKLGNDSIQMLFGDDLDRLFESIKSGKLSAKALSTVSLEQLSENVINNKIRFEDLFKAYSEFDAINVSDLKKVFTDYEEDYFLRQEEGEEVGEKIELVDYIKNDTSVDKIRELYIANVLTHSDILILEEKKILTEEQRKVISMIDRDRLFDAIMQENIVASEKKAGKKKPGEGEDGEKPEKKSKSSIKKIKNRKEFLEELGNAEFKDIETANSIESFYGYTIAAYRDYGLIVMENFKSNRNTGTFVMTIEEFRSLIETDKEGNPILVNGSVVFTKGRKKIKSELDKHQALICRNHRPLWGSNVIDSMRKLSNEARLAIDAKTQIDLGQRMITEFYAEDLNNVSKDSEEYRRINAEIEFSRTNLERRILKREKREIDKKRSKEKADSKRRSPNGE